MDFITASKEGEGEVTLTKVPRLLSVVNIWSHLATTHQTDLRTAVHTILPPSPSFSPSPPSALV